MIMTAPQTSAPQTSSNGGRLVSADGRALPLRHVHLAAEAAGGIARVTLTQTFFNPHDEPLEVRYLLPLPSDGAVSGFSFTLADQRVTGEVTGKQVARHFPKPLERAAQRAEEFARGMLTGGTLFEEMGFFYVGPVDGHNLDHLVPILKKLKGRKQGPVLLHVVTEKGRGHPFNEANAEKYHAVAKFDVVTGAQAKPKPNAPNTMLGTPARLPTAIRTMLTR